MTWRLAMLLLLCAACGGDGGAAAAMQAFGAFQHAAQAGDRAAVAALLTEESQPVVDCLPWHELRTRKLLLVDGAERCDAQWWIAVRDPNDGDRPGTYVVVREGGRLCVDLLASMAHNCATTETPTKPHFEPRPLTDEQVARAQAMGYSAPH